MGADIAWRVTAASERRRSGGAQRRLALSAQDPAQLGTAPGQVAEVRAPAVGPVDPH